MIFYTLHGFAVLFMKMVHILNQFYHKAPSRSFASREKLFFLVRSDQVQASPQACLGKPVQDRHGPAAVTGDDTSSMSLPFIQEQWEDAGEDRPGSRKTDLIALIGCTHGFLGRCTFVDISRT